MKITRLTTAVVEGNFDWTLVRLDTDEGLKGLGECFFAPGLTRILRELAPLILGRDARDIRSLFRRLQMATSGAGSVAGIVYNAISGIELALWDLLGQHAGLPIYRLLGGKFRDRIRIYADCHAGESLESLDSVLRSRRASWTSEAEPHTTTDYFDDHNDSVAFTPEMYGKRAMQMVEAGFTALKFDVDVPNPYRRDLHNRCLSNSEIDYLCTLIAGVRQAVGFDVDLAVDCHWRFNASDALKLAVRFEEFRLLWLEDPLPPWSVNELRDIRTSTRTPVATGENLYLFEGFRALLQERALSIACPDLQKVGGLAEARRIAEFADSCNIAIAPHNISSPIGTFAAAHFCAATPNFLALEFHAHDVPFWLDLLVEPDHTLIRNGHIQLPEKPGLGVTLNEEAARKYARPGEPFFE